MLGQLLLGFDLPRWELVAIPIVGLTSAGVTLLVGRTLLRRRIAPPSLQEKPPQKDPFVFGSATEKRTSIRRSGKLIKVLVAEAEDKIGSIEGWVIDRSMGGLCLALPQAVLENSILNVRTAEGSVNSPWVQVQVKRSQANGPHWEIGCQFLRTPPWSILLQFG